MMKRDLITFLRELRQHNDREWFVENKKWYEQLRKEFTGRVQEVIDRVAAFDPDIVGQQAKDCLFRIYRDVRFSPDKSPYKHHFSAYLAKGGRKSIYAGYYIHIEPDNCLLSGGIWMPDSKLLKKLRQDVYDNADEFLGIMSDPQFKKLYPEMDSDTTMKRMPAGFPADDPLGDLVRRKYYVVTTGKPDSLYGSDNWTDEVAEAFRVMQPFNRFLNYSVDEYLSAID